MESTIRNSIELDSTFQAGGAAYLPLYDINGNVLKDLNGETLYGLTQGFISKMDENSFIDTEI